MAGSMSMEFSDIGRHPLLRPESIDGVLTYFPKNPNIYPLAQRMPLVAYNADRVRMDVSKARAGGMTPMVATGSASPIYGGFGRGTVEFDAVEFREKVVLTEQDLVLLRRLGSLSDLEDARRILARKFAVVEERLMNRLEWMRRQVLFENQVALTTQDGLAYNVQYAHPDFLEVALSGADLWSATGTADPLANIQEWVEDYMVDTGFAVDVIMIPRKMYRHLLANTKFRETAVASHGAFTETVDNIRGYMATYAGLSPTQIVQNTDAIRVDTELTAASAQADTTLDLLDVHQLAAGETIYVARASDRYKEKFTVASIAGNVVTVGTGVADAGGFQAGDAVSYNLPIIPENKILILGRAPGNLSSVGAEGAPDQNLLNNWGEMATTLSGYADLPNRRPGIFSKTFDETDQDPPRIEQVIGIKALPKINYYEGWFVATVL